MRAFGGKKGYQGVSEGPRTNAVRIEAGGAMNWDLGRTTEAEECRRAPPVLALASDSALADFRLLLVLLFFVPRSFFSIFCVPQKSKEICVRADWDTRSIDSR